MRRACRIVNEMEFRMWREAKSFSPPARAGTMKRFPSMHRLAESPCDSLPCFILAQHRPRTPHVLENNASLKRRCLAQAQYGRPFH